MSERLNEAQKFVGDIFQSNGVTMALEAMEIVNKYAGVEGAKLLEMDINQLQADSIKLVSYNFYLGTIASHLAGEAKKAYNARKFQGANIWVSHKKLNPKDTNGVIDQISESQISEYRNIECETERRAAIVASVCGSITEIVNMLKKVVERMIVQNNTHFAGGS